MVNFNYIKKMKRQSYILEGFTDEGAPDMKYYAFDWDDNIMFMPTKIVLKDENGKEVGMSTEDFAKYRTIIGKENFEYNGHKIVNFADRPFRYFREDGDKRFIIDSMLAKKGPSWSDFVEAINGGSIFAIITARGHNPEVLKEATYNLIVSNNDGINSNELIKNLEKYRDIGGEGESKKDIIKEYLEMCKFYPVTYGDESSAANPEELKVKALQEFVNYVKEISSYINKKAYLKNDVKNLFLPQIGFSDDDIRNVENIKKHFEDLPGNIVKTYSTAGGTKERY